MLLHVMGAVTALVCQNSSHMGSVSLANVALSDPLSCIPVHEPSPSHGSNTSCVCVFLFSISFSNLICCRAIIGLVFSVSMHRLAIHWVVSIATSTASSPGSVIQIALHCIGYVVSSDRICILGTGKDMKGSRNRLAKRTSAVATEDRRKPQIITGRTLCK